MVAIVAGQGLGGLNTSLGLLGEQGQLGVLGQGRAGERVRVNAANGNLVVQQQDEWLVGVGPDVALVRSYNSQALGVDDNADNWRLGLSRRVQGLTGPVNTAGSTIKRVGEDGAEAFYSWDATRALYVSREGGGSFDTLSYNATSKQWTWTDGDTQVQETYDVVNAAASLDARLAGVKDLDGRQIKLSYADASSSLITEIATWSASAASGEKVTITYDTVAGKTSNIVSMTTTYVESSVSKTLKRVSYSYDSYNRLQEVVVDLSPGDLSVADGAIYKTQYTYDDAVTPGTKRLKTLIQSDGSKLEFGYDASARIISVKETVNAQVLETRLDYSVAGTTTITDALGQVTTLTYDTSSYSASNPKAGQLLSIKAPAVNGQAQLTTYDYDANGNVTRVTDARGNFTAYLYDAQGNRIYERNVQGVVVERTYSATNQLLSQTTSISNQPPVSSAGDLNWLYIAEGNATILNDRVTKTNGADAWGDAAVRSRDGYTGGASVSFTPTLANKNLMVGLSADPSVNHNYNTIDWAMFCTADGRLQAYENGVASSFLGTYVAGDTLSVVYDGAAVRYFKNGVVLRTVAATITQPLYADSSFYSVGAQISNLQFAAQSYVSEGGCTTLGDWVSKTGGVADTWDSSVRSNTSYTGGAAVSFSAAQVDKSLMVGLTTDPQVNNSYNTLDWALYCRVDGNLQVYENGVATALLGSYAVGDTLSVVYDGQAIRYFKNSVVLRTVVATIAQPLYMDSSFCGPGGTVRNLKFGAPSYVTDGNVTIIGDTAEKTAGVQSVWDAAIRSMASYRGGASVSFSTAQTNKDLMVGLTTDPTANISYNTIDWALFCRNDGYLQAYENGTASAVLGYYAVGDTLSVTYDGAVMRYLKNGVVLRTVAAVITEPLFVDSSFYNIGAKVQGLTFRARATSATQRYIYGANGHLRFMVSPEGRVTEYQYNADGSRKAQIQYAGGSVYVAADGVWALGEAELASWVSSQDKSRTQRVDYSYNSRGQLDKQTTYGAVDASGVGVLDGSQSVTQYVYDQAGNLLKQIDGRGHVSSYSYDGLNRVRVQTRLDSGGAVLGTTTSVYNDTQRQTVVTAANGLVTTSTYDASGAVLSVSQADGASALGTTSYTYDKLGRLRAVSTPTGDKSYTLYDAAGRQVGNIDAEGVLTESVYNANNQVVRTIRYATKVDPAKITGDGSALVLDGSLGVRPAASAGADRVRLNVYDKAARLVMTVDEIGAVVEYRYDAAGRLTDTLAYASALSPTQLNALMGSTTELQPSTGALLASSGTITLATHADDRRSRSFYGADGQRVGQLDAQGFYSAYSHDGAGRLVKTTRYAKALVGTLADGNTPPSVVSSASGAVYVLADSANDQLTQYVYNSRGQLIGELDAESYYSAYQYDASGNRSSVTRYANKVSSFDGKSAPALTAHAEDQKTTYTFDANNRLKREEVTPTGVVTTYEYDSVGNLTRTVKALGQLDERSQQRRYDKLGRLTAELGGEGSKALAQLLQTTPGASQAQIDAIWASYGLQHQYDSAGRRIATIEPNGSDAGGIKTVYYYDKVGRLTHSINALGEVLQYEYNSFGEQLTQTRLGTKVSSPGSLTGGLSSALGTTVSSLLNVSKDSRSSTSYDQRGQIYSVSDALGYVSNTRQYNSFGELISRVDRQTAGTTAQTTYSYSRRGELLSSQNVSLSITSSRTLDAFGRVIAQVDGNGKSSTLTYDRLGRQVQSTDRSGAGRTNTYDAFARVLSATDALGNVTTYSYDSANRKVTVTTAENIQTVTESSRHGQIVKVTDGRSQATTYSYNADGQLLSTSAPAGISTSTSYDKAGRVYESTDARGTVTRTTYDAASRVLTRVVDPGGLNLSTEFRYDAQGRSIWRKDANGVWTQTEYDLQGQVTAIVVDPKRTPNWVSGADDNAAGLALRTQYTYDVQGRTLSVMEGAGTPQAKTTQYEYDAAGRRTKEIVDPAGLKLTTLYAYDKNDNLISRTDAKGQITSYVYDAQNRQIYVVDATGAVTKNDYDHEGHLSRSRAYANRIAVASGITESYITSRLSANEAQDQVTRYAYNKDGRRTHSVAPMGYVTAWEYDQAGNVVKQTRYATAASSMAVAKQNGVLFSYSAPVVSAHALDRVEQTVYDAAGRAIYSVDALNGVTQRTFDGNGNVTKVTRYANAMTGQLATNGTPAVLADASRDQVSHTVYDKANRATYTVDALNYVTASGYDALGRLKSLTRYGTALGSYTAGAIPAVTVNASVDAKTSYEYDSAGRTTKVTDALGVITYNQYDAAGRLTDQTRAWGTADASTTHYNYDAAGRVTAEVTAYGKGEQASTSYTLDALGQRTGVTAAGYTTQQEFDAAGRITKSTSALSSVISTEYDAFGNAVKVTDPNGNVGYFYFDQRNQSLWSVDPEGYVVGTRYDAFGEAQEITRYDAKVVGTLTTATTLKAYASAGEATTAGASVYVLKTVGQDAVSAIVHDKLGRQTTLTDAEGYNELMAYDMLGNKSEYTNKLGGKYIYTHDKLGRVLSEKAPVQVKELDAGGLIKLSNGQPIWRDVITRFAYDARGNVTQKTEAEGLVEQRITQYGYDLLNRLTSTTGEAMATYTVAGGEKQEAPVETRVYDKRGNLIELKAADGGRTLSYWDANDRKIAELNPTGTLSTWSYATDGKPTAQRVYGDVLSLPVTPGGAAPVPSNAANVREVLYTYDGNRRLTETRTKNVTTGSRDASTGAYSVTTGDVVSTKEYDKAGYVVKEVDGRGNATFSYVDKLGNKTLQVDAERYVTQWTYDEAGNVTSQTRYANALPAGTAVTTASTVASLLAAIPTPGDKRVVEYSYDRMGRKTLERTLNVAYAEVNTSSGLLAEKLGSVSTLFEYNALGAVTKQTDATAAVTQMSYDKQGRLIKTQAPQFVDWEGAAVRPTTEVDYNALGLQSRVIQRGKNDAVETDDRITIYIYGKNGARISERDAMGHTTSYAYDQAMRVTRRDISRVNADAVVSNDRLAVRYDLAGRQVEQITSSKLASAPSYVQLKSEQMVYSAFGEITRKGENGGAQRQYEYDSAGRLWRSNGADNGAAKVYYYDANGNATLELSSSSDDLMSAATLPDRSAAALSALLQANKANPTFNVYDKLNKLVESFEPAMSGLTQAASLAPRTETVTTVTPQDPFVAGEMTGVQQAVSVNRTISFSTSYKLSYYASITLPNATIYGVGSYRVVVKLRVWARHVSGYYCTTVGGFDFVTPGGAFNISKSISSAYGSNTYTAYGSAITEIYQITSNGEIKIAYGEFYKPCDKPMDTMFENSIVYDTKPAQNTLNIVMPKTKNLVVSGFGEDAAYATIKLKNSSESSYTSISGRDVVVNGYIIRGSFYFEIPETYKGDYTYEYSVLNASGGKLSGAHGAISFGDGGVPVIVYREIDVRPDVVTYTYNNYLDWTLSAAAAFDLSVRRKQAYNAYGEQVRGIRYKRDDTNTLVEVSTEFAYNALGKLIQKKDPAVLVTLENGFRKQVSPTTRYFYDAVGRMVGVQDANGNVNTLSVLAGSTAEQPITASEFHADRRLVETAVGSGVFVAREGVKRNQYDIFGQLRRSANENWDGVADNTPYATTYAYNANGHLSSIDRPGAADESYEVDSQGNRIATTLAPDANGTRHRERTYFDALGRITQTSTAFGRNTSYTYEWVAAIAGGGGWRRTTTTLDGTLIDDTDVFGRARWHKDLSNRAFSYRYNNAGLLSSQSSLAADGTPSGIVATLTYTGQDLSFSYYGNGLLKDTIDNARLSWTKYRYDDSGNRVFEGYARNYGTAETPDWEYYQYSEASYDDAGRLVRVWDPKSDINYEYDAAGNRRRVTSKYHDGAQGGLQTQDYWYAYDNMNRFTVTMGSLSSANGNTRATTESDSTIKVVQGANGRLVGYDYASQRKSAVTAQGTESYSYDAEGYLQEVKLNSSRIAWRDSDARGNVMVLEENTPEGVVRRTFSYDADNNLKTERNELLANGTTKLKSTTDNTLMASGLLDISVTREYKDDGVTVTNTITTDNDYVYWDGAKQSQISIRATNPKVSRYWEPGSTTLSYDVNGHTERATDLAGNRHFYYSTDADGRVIRREEIDAPDRKPSKQNRVAAQRSQLFFQNYYFFNGKEVGTVSNDPAAIMKDYGQALIQGKQEAYYKRAVVVSADFDQNYQPIGTSYPARTASTYTVLRSGESLQQIAQAVWGDGSLWYLIAEANGLSSSSALTQGQRLVIPNKVTNIHNNTQTSRPYDAAQALGDINPTLPDPPPPPQKSCGGLLQILVAVVAIAVTAWVGGALAGQLGNVMGYALGGAAGSIASQGVAIATGLQEKFSWKGVAMGAIGGAISGGFMPVNGAPSALGKLFTIEGNALATTVLRGAVSNAMTQGVSVALGLQDKFDWRGVAAAGVGSAAGYGMAQLMGKLDLPALREDNWGTRMAYGTMTGLANGAARSVIMGQRPNWASIAVESFGSALGDAVVGSIVQREQAAFESKHPVVSADEKAQILAGFADGPGGEVAGQGLRLKGGPNGNGFALTRSGVAAFDEGMDNARQARQNWESASGRVWDAEDRAYEATRLAGIKQQNINADAYGKQLAREAAAKREYAAARTSLDGFVGGGAVSAGSFAAGAAGGQSIFGTPMPMKLGNGGQWVANPDHPNYIVPPVAYQGQDSNFLGFVKEGVSSISADAVVWGGRNGGTLGTGAAFLGYTGLAVGELLPGNTTQLALGAVGGAAAGKILGYGVGGLNSLASKSSLTSWASADLTLAADGAMNKVAFALQDAKKTFNYEYRHWFSGKTILDQSTTFYSFKNPSYFKAGTEFAPLELWMTPQAMTSEQAVNRLALPYASGYDAMLTVNLPAGTTIMTPRRVWSLFGREGGGIETRSYTRITSDMYTVGKPPSGSID